MGELSKALNANYMRARHGGPLSPRSKAHLIWSLRTFFRDLQEWEWIERRFDPRRAFALPRSIKTLIGPDPRVISDEIWAKLMWAGLNLTTRDRPRHGQPGGNGAPWYPLELVRAVALLWLFAGLRVDEILRLPVGAIRWQHAQRDGERRVCLLDVPTNKTGTRSPSRSTAVGDAIELGDVRPRSPGSRIARPASWSTCCSPTAARGSGRSTSTRS